jgi:5-methylcytosine-specific restriction endonuclease McrA
MKFTNSTQFKKGIPSWNKGKKHSEETKNKIRIRRLKNPTRYWLGKHIPKEMKDKISKTMIEEKTTSRENSPNWKGGVTQIRKAIEGSTQYKQWRQQIFIRDSFTCQKCGDKGGGNLEAHHKKSLSELRQEARTLLPLFNLYDACILYTPFWDISNGITLCKKCHKKITFGNKKKKGG